MSLYGNVILEAVLSSKDRKKMDDKQFGIPELRKYPLNDEKHVRAAITYFNKCDPKYEAELARNIKKRMKELGMEVEVSDDNRFSKYYKAPAKKEDKK